MNNLLVQPELVPLLQALKPYLGSKGQTVSDGVSNILKLVTSEPGREALNTLDNVLSTWGVDGKPISFNTPLGQVQFSMGSVFVLFLILVLILLAGKFPALSIDMDEG